jgi:hypothetical protein
MAKQVRLTAYENSSTPNPIMPIFMGILGGALIGSIFSCCGFSAATPEGGEASGGAVLAALLLMLVGIVAGAGIQFARYQKAKKRHEEHLEFQQRYFQEVDNILRETIESAGEWLANQDWSQWHSLYRPKSDEKVLYMAAATMTEQRERVEAVARVGAVKFSKMPFKSIGYANVEKVIEHKVNYDHVEGKGVLIVTHQSLRFISQGHGQNWSMPWSDVMSWQPAINAILVQPASGTPKAFIIDGAGFEAMRDTQVVDKALELGHDA